MNERAGHIRRTTVLERPTEFLSQVPCNIGFAATRRPIEEDSIRQSDAVPVEQFRLSEWFENIMRELFFQLIHPYDVRQPAPGWLTWLLRAQAKLLKHLPHF